MMFINIITHRLKVILENVCGMFQTTAYTFGLHVRLPVSVVELHGVLLLPVPGCGKKCTPFRLLMLISAI